MAMLNIGRDNADAAYRYKMPALVTKIEGRGNGIKTVIVNMVDVAKALHIHPAYPTKYFGIEFGAQSKYNIATERAIVNGSHNQPDLQRSLDKFIQTFILCPNCRLPEIKMSISEKKGTITIKCDACGYNELLKTPHKLSQYILKNPPKSFDTKDKDGKKKKPKDDDKEETEEKGEDEEDASKEKKKKKKAAGSVGGVDSESSSSGGKDKEKKKKKKEKKEDDETNEEEPEADSEEKEKKKKEKKEKKKKEKAEKGAEDANTESASAGSTNVTSKEEKKPEDGWFSDTSAEAQRARKEAEFAELGKTSTGERISKSADVDAILNAAKTKQTEGSPVTLLKVYIASAPTDKPRLPVEIVAEVKRLGLARALDEPQKIKVLLEALVDADQPKTAKTVFDKSAPILKLVATDKNSATILLNCVEDLVGVTAPKLVSFTAHILQALYDNDVVEEDVLVAWHQLPPESSWLTNKEVAATVRAKAEPFIKWLQEAEEEEDD